MYLFTGLVPTLLIRATPSVSAAMLGLVAALRGSICWNKAGERGELACPVGPGRAIWVRDESSCVASLLLCKGSRESGLMGSVGGEDRKGLGKEKENGGIYGERNLRKRLA